MRAPGRLVQMFSAVSSGGVGADMRLFAQAGVEEPPCRDQVRSVEICTTTRSQKDQQTSKTPRPFIGA